jgi:PEP-CTERM motif-containing protein
MDIGKFGVLRPVAAAIPCNENTVGAPSRRKVNVMKFQRLIAALAIAICSFSVKAELFDYSYTFHDGAVVSGSFTGNINGQYVDSVSNVSASLNGTIFSNSPYLLADGYDINNGGQHTDQPTISFDGHLNNFRFTGVELPGGSQDYFIMFNVPGITIADASAAGFWVGDTGPMPMPPFDIPGNYDALRWSLTVANPVPEPEAYAMMLAGLGLLGFMARRRKQKLVAA